MVGRTISLPRPIVKVIWVVDGECKSRVGSNQIVHHGRSNRCLYRARRMRSNSRIPYSYLRSQSFTANPTNVNRSRTHIASEPSPVKLVGKRTSSAAAGQDVKSRPWEAATPVRLTMQLIVGDGGRHGRCETMTEERKSKRPGPERPARQRARFWFCVDLS